MVDVLPQSKRQFVVLLTPAGTPYQAGTDVASSVEISGDALTALETIATNSATIVTRLNTLITAVGAAGDAVGANTVIGQLKQIAANTGV